METKIDLKEEIRRLGVKTQFSLFLLEKDYHLTRILHKVSEKQIKDLVFKGGTCLNKCYLGFYRLSEDLDFVFNQDVKDFSRSQVKKVLDELRRKFLEILEELGLETNKELGIGWKMLTSKENPKIVGLEIRAKYNSLIDNSQQTIKLEVSFRKKLIKSTQRRVIYHEFINALNQPILKDDVKIEVIDLDENFAEKFRALITRKTIAVRDIFDIYFILKNKAININQTHLDLAIIKINETENFSYTKKDLLGFINNLDSKIESLNEKELVSVLNEAELVSLESMIFLIKKELLLS